MEKASRVTASAFLVALIAAVPYKIHTVLTDNGIQLRLPPRYADGPTARYVTHMFDMRCRENGIEHRFTKINRPWTTDVIDKSFFASTGVFSARARVTLWHRAVLEVQILPRALIVAPP